MLKSFFDSVPALVGDGPGRKKTGRGKGPGWRGKPRGQGWFKNRVNFHLPIAFSGEGCCPGCFVCRGGRRSEINTGVNEKKNTTFSIQYLYRYTTTLSWGKIALKMGNEAGTDYDPQLRSENARGTELRKPPKNIQQAKKKKGA